MQLKQLTLSSKFRGLFYLNVIKDQCVSQKKIYEIYTVQLLGSGYFVCKNRDETQNRKSRELYICINLCNVVQEIWKCGLHQKSTLPPYNAPLCACVSNTYLSLLVISCIFLSITLLKTISHHWLSALTSSFWALVTICRQIDEWWWFLF